MAVVKVGWCMCMGVHHTAVDFGMCLGFSVVQSLKIWCIELIQEVNSFKLIDCKMQQ